MHGGDFAKILNQEQVRINKKRLLMKKLQNITLLKYYWL